MEHVRVPHRTLCRWMLHPLRRFLVRWLLTLIVVMVGGCIVSRARADTWGIWARCPSPEGNVWKLVTTVQHSTLNGGTEHYITGKALVGDTGSSVGSTSFRPLDSGATEVSAFFENGVFRSGNFPLWLCQASPPTGPFPCEMPDENIIFENAGAETWAPWGNLAGGSSSWLSNGGLGGYSSSELIPSYPSAWGGNYGDSGGGGDPPPYDPATTDTDNDGQMDANDSDDDGDGMPDEQDAYPLSSSLEGVGLYGNLHQYETFGHVDYEFDYNAPLQHIMDYLSEIDSRVNHGSTNTQALREAFDAYKSLDLAYSFEAASDRGALRSAAEQENAWQDRMTRSGLEGLTSAQLTARAAAVLSGIPDDVAGVGAPRLSEDSARVVSPLARTRIYSAAEGITVGRFGLSLPEDDRDDGDEEFWITLPLSQLAWCGGSGIGDVQWNLIPGGTLGKATRHLMRALAYALISYAWLMGLIRTFRGPVS